MSTAPDPRVWQAVEALWEVAEAEQVADPERFLAARPALEPAVVELFLQLWAQRSKDAQGASTGVTQLLAQQVGGHSEARYRQGQCIGRYRLLRQLGEGGAGVVYLAESVEADLRHQVAIKLLHEGLDDNDPLQRSVQQERRLLARLVHPCITRYHDSGVTEDGLSYVVVEYVDGLPITRHVREQGCSAVVTLRLFAQTARAVHYAHQNLVVHRDIKPSNVLVDSRHDLPKLLDFGIARDLEGRGADEHTELFAHTPAYASPEQLAGDASIGTPTDLYSLGLLLHEIVLGRLPVPPATRHPATRMAQLRQLPAVRLPDSHEDALPLTGLHRGQLRDLAAVISRLLSFHPEDRYPSAEALAVDIDRILDDQPIQSTHHALRRRLWRWLRRNRALATASVAGLLLAIGAAGIYVAQSQDLARQAVRLSSVRALLSDLLTRPDPLRRGASVTLLETVESMLPQLDAPDLDADVRSEIQGILGRTLLRLGRVEQATALLQQAHAHVLLARPDSPERRSLEASLALAALEAGQYVDAREQALALVAALRQDRGAEALPLARALRILATARIHADNDLPGAQADARSALARLEAAGNPDVSEAATTRSVLALALSLAGELDEAATLQQAVLDDVQSREGADAALTFDPRNNLARTLQRQGQLAAAEQLLAHNVDLAQQLFGAAAPDTLMAQNNLAVNLFRQGRFDQAVPLMRAVRDGRVQALGAEHPRTLTAVTNLADALIKTGALDEGCALSAQAMQALRFHPAAAPQALGYPTKVHARCLAARGEPQAALAELRSVVALWSAQLGPHHLDTLNARQDEAQLLAALGRRQEALTLIDEVLGLRSEHYGADHPANREAADWRATWAAD